MSKKRTPRQRADIAALKSAIEAVKDGGAVMMLHIAKTAGARRDFLTAQAQAAKMVAEKLMAETNEGPNGAPPFDRATTSGSRPSVHTTSPPLPILPGGRVKTP